MPSAPNQPRPRDRDMSLTGIPYAPTRFVQLLTPRRASAYLRNATEGGFSRAYVQGFFVQEEALAQCLTASAVLGVMDVGWLSERGRLASFRGPLPDASDQLSPGTVATCSGSGASCVYVLCFDVASDLEATLTHQDPPGHCPASGAWWHSGEPMAILPGARIEAIDEDGHRRVLAHWNAETNGLWHWGGLGEPGSFSTLATIFERTFSRGRGWVPIRPLDSRRGLVHAADRRILRFLLGDALIQSGAGVAAWGIVDLAAADTLVCTTHVSYWGVVGVLTGFHPDGAGNTLASLTAHVPWSPAVEQAGMWGDEMGGFHADIPLEETGSFAHESVVAPTRSPSTPLEELPIPWGAARQERWHGDFIELPSGTRAPVVVTEDGRVHAEAPDPRSVGVLFPGPSSYVCGPGSNVWVDITDQGGVLLEATTTGQIFGVKRLTATIIGESRDEWHYHTPSLVRSVEATSRPPHWAAKTLVTHVRDRLTLRPPA